MDDQHCFHLQPRDGTLEASAQSQEQDARDPEHVKSPSPSEARKKTDTEKEIIHLTSLVVLLPNPVDT
jgi:hypothetical protein